MRGAKRFAASESAPATNDTAFRNKRVMAGSAFDAHRAEPSQPQSNALPPLDTRRAESSRQHVRALNTQFASWVQTQLKNHPDELWEDGVRDYLAHASNILDKFSDVVNWLKANAMKAESTSESLSTDKRAVPEFKGTENKLLQEKTGLAPPSTSTSFTTSWSSGVFSSSQSSGGISSNNSNIGVSSSTPSFGLFSNTQGSGGVSSNNSNLGVSSSTPSFGLLSNTQGSGGVSSNDNSNSGVSSGTQSFGLFSNAQSSGGASSTNPNSGVFSSSQSFGLFSGTQASGLLSTSQSSGLFSNTQSSGFLSNSQSTGLFSNSQSSGLFCNGQSTGLFSTGQSVGVFSTLTANSQTPVLDGNQGSTATNNNTSDNADDENELQQPSSPSVKKSEEKGIIVVHEVKCKLYVKSSDPADKDAWKDKGTGQLSIKCKEGVSKGTKESAPTIVVRNDVGKVMLNALLYPGIKTNSQKNSIVAIFHTAGDDAGNSDKVVARTFLIRTKTEEDRNKLATAIQEYAPSA